MTPAFRREFSHPTDLFLPPTGYHYGNKLRPSICYGCANTIKNKEILVMNW
jgi:hypothetical protein